MPYGKFHLFIAHCISPSLSPLLSAPLKLSISSPPPPPPLPLPLLFPHCLLVKLLQRLPSACSSWKTLFQLPSPSVYFNSSVSSGRDPLLFQLDFPILKSASPCSHFCVNWASPSPVSQDSSGLRR